MDIRKSLPQDTRLFWEMSLVFNGRKKSNLTVEQALNNLNRIKTRYSPTRSLITRCYNLSDRIVSNNAPASKKSKQTKAIKKSVEK